MDVNYGRGNRYCFVERGAPASSNSQRRAISFKRKWFEQLSPKARCSVVVHEIWHWKIMKKKTRLKWRFLRDSVVYGFITVLILGLTTVLPFFGLSPIISLLGFIAWVLVLFRVIVPPLIDKYQWSIEYECDEAGVRFMGPDSTKEILKTFKTKGKYGSHPPARMRLLAVDRVAPRYPVPEIDFDQLQRNIPQIVVVLKTGE